MGPGLQCLSNKIIHFSPWKYFLTCPASCHGVLSTPLLIRLWLGTKWTPSVPQLGVRNLGFQNQLCPAFAEWHWVSLNSLWTLVSLSGKKKVGVEGRFWPGQQFLTCVPQKMRIVHKMKELYGQNKYCIFYFPLGDTHNSLAFEGLWEVLQ